MFKAVAGAYSLINALESLAYNWGFGAYPLAGVQGQGALKLKTSWQSCTIFSLTYFIFLHLSCSQ